MMRTMRCARLRCIRNLWLFFHGSTQNVIKSALDLERLFADPLMSIFRRTWRLVCVRLLPRFVVLLCHLRRKLMMFLLPVRSYQSIISRSVVANRNFLCLAVATIMRSLGSSWKPGNWNDATAISGVRSKRCTPSVRRACSIHVGKSGSSTRFPLLAFCATSKHEITLTPSPVDTKLSRRSSFFLDNFFSSRLTHQIHTLVSKTIIHWSPSP